MTKSRLDEEIELIERALAALRRAQFAAFFAACGERLLPLYSSFSSAEAWGDPKQLRDGLDVVWSHLSGGALPDVPRLLENLEAVTPHSDDFETPASSYAQNAVICVDAALRAIWPKEQVDPSWVQYPVETVKVAICVAENGVVDLGSSPEAIEWSNRVAEHPRMREELQFLRKLIGVLRTLDFSSHSISELQALAMMRTFDQN